MQSLLPSGRGAGVKHSSPACGRRRSLQYCFFCRCARPGGQEQQTRGDLAGDRPSRGEMRPPSAGGLRPRDRLRRRPGRHGPPLGRSGGEMPPSGRSRRGAGGPAGQSAERRCDCRRRWASPASWAAASAPKRRFANCSGWACAAGHRHVGPARARVVSPDVSRSFPAGWCWESTPAADGWPPRAGNRPATWRRSIWPDRFAGEPLAALIYTDIATDGMMAGPNLAAMAEMQAAVDWPVVASGGVTTADDVARLAAVPMAGCIIGRALYEGTLTLPEALAAAEAQQPEKIAFLNVVCRLHACKQCRADGRRLRTACTASSGNLPKETFHGQVFSRANSQHRFLWSRFGRQDHAGRQDPHHHRRRQPQRQRRRRHEHLRLRRRGEAPQVHDRVQRDAFRSRRQAVQHDRHARLSRFHRPGDRRHARRRYGGDRHQRPVGHRGQHPPRLRRGRRRPASGG